MSPKEAQLISQTGDYVKEVLQNAEGGHDWFHTQRVYWMACHLARETGADLLTVAWEHCCTTLPIQSFMEGMRPLGPEWRLPGSLSSNWIPGSFNP